MAGSRTAVLRRVIRSATGAEFAATDRELLHRFAREGDERAFEALVNRHAAMVLGVCRRALPTVQDAEDACQATFLLLARKAGSVRWEASAANWLYTAARKVAHNARVAADRRAKREAKAAVPEAVEPVDRMTVRELLGALDEELSKLSPRYREPLVLCHLEGLTLDEAAVRLGVPVATLKTRTVRGRKQLADALTKRGCALGAGLLALAVTSPAGASPPRLVESILAAASGSPSAAASELVRGVAVSGTFNKAVLALVVVGAATLGVGLGVLGPTTASQGSDEPVGRGKGNDHTAQPTVVAPEITISGRVLGPDDKPLAGAKVWVVPRSDREGGFEPLAEPRPVGADGRFLFTVPKGKTRHPKYGHDRGAAVLATADGYFPAWAGRHEDVTLKLTKADAKLAGRVVNLEGRPVAGATVRVRSVSAPVAGTLDPWLNAVRERKEPDAALLGGHFGDTITAARLPGVAITARTDARGRFELSGLGRDLRLWAVVEGPGIATQTVGFVTRDVGGESAITFGAGSPIYGAGGTVAVGPSRPVTGVVRDRQTGKPLGGVVVQSVTVAGSSHFQVGLVRTQTGADGRFTLEGMPPGAGNTIAAVPTAEQAHLGASADVPDGPGSAPVTVDFNLGRGVWVEGVVRDRQGKPVPHASVAYFPDEENDRVPAGDRVGGATRGGVSGADGKFRVVGLPGKGYVVAAAEGNRYLAAADRVGEGGADATILRTLPIRVRTNTVNAAHPIDVPTKAESFTRDVTLEAGLGLTVKLTGPDGKIVPGVRSFGHAPAAEWGEEARPGEHAVTAYNPKRPRSVLFRDAEKNLVARLDLPKDFAGAGHTVEMRPGVTLVGRVLDADGKPRAGLAVGTSFLWSQWDDSAEAWARFAPGAERVVTDAEGRFRVPTLVPGTSYAVVVKSRYLSEFRLDPSASGVKDLGDLRLPLEGD